MKNPALLGNYDINYDIPTETDQLTNRQETGSKFHLHNHDGRLMSIFSGFEPPTRLFEVPKRIQVHK